MSDDPAIKRLRLRSWRRGIREMDLILGTFADERLPQLSDDDRALYEEMLSESDIDLYRWVSGQGAAPARFAALIERIAAHTGARMGRSN